MPLANRIDATDYYDRDAERFAARYDSVTFEAVHPFLRRYLPASGNALDIGAGSGRDARALVGYGLDVTAVEPSVGLRRIGEASDDRIRWVDDRLPELSSFTDEFGIYDLILCSAVLMLIAPAELAESFATMARLLKSTGRIAINIRQPVQDEPRDLFFAHSDTEVLAAASAAFLSCLDRTEADDALGRTPYRWSSFVFKHSADHTDALS